jgi:CRISPR-associated endonuclease Csn1
MEKGCENQRLLGNLPDASWQFLMSITQNEMIVFGIEKEKLEELISQKAYDQISHKIYRVQKLGKSASGAIDIFFRHHLETSVDDKKFGGEDLAKKAGILIRASSLSTLLDRNAQKVRTNVMGEILLI